MTAISRLSIVLAGVLIVWSPHLLAQSGNDLFQKALAKERAEGQLDAAIRLYEQVLRDFAADRTLAARTLLQIGRCYERLGGQRQSEVWVIEHVLPVRTGARTATRR